MSTASVDRIEPRLQRMSALARVRSLNLNVPRLPALPQRKSQQRQSSLPVGPTTPPPPPPMGRKSEKKEKKSENIASSSSPGDTIVCGSNEQHVSSLVQVVNQPIAEIDKRVSLPPQVGKREAVTFASPDTAGGVEGRTDTGPGVIQKKRKIFAVTKSHPSSANVKIEGEQIAPQGVLRNKLRKAKTTFRSMKTPFRRDTRQSPATEGPIASTSATQSDIPISASDEPSQTKTIRRGVEETSTTVLYAEGRQSNSADTRDEEMTTTESQEVERLRKDLSNSYSQIAELQKRCEAQSRDLENSNSFLSAADKSSDSDVIQALHRLNAEVQQDTSYMADCMAEGFEFTDLMTNPTKELIPALQRASGHIGLALVKSLETKSPENIPMLLQIAFQAYLASVLCETASSWAFEAGQNAFISGIYQRLRKVEAQAISGRWRVLARVHTVQSWATHPELLVKAIIVGISDILLASGCTAPQSDITSKVTSMFEEKITLLVELARRLNRMIDEVISSDLEVFVVRPGETFDDKNMEEDTDGGKAGIQEVPVLCTTHLGLIKRIPVGTLWERGKKQKMVALRAKVLTESFLDME